MLKAFKSPPGTTDWVKVSKNLPKNAIVGGRAREDCPIYIGRVKEFGELKPVGVIKAKHTGKITAHLAYGGRETVVDIPKHGCEVYCEGDVRWMRAFYGNLPHGAIPVAPTSRHNALDETMYVGRATYMGQLIVGKVHPSHECLYIPYQGTEIPLREYEVLVKVNVV